MRAGSESREIIAALRACVVSSRGLAHFASGLEALAKAVAEDLSLVGEGKAGSKWIRGEYGTGKTFAARYLCMEARARGFVTSEVQISINDTPLHHLETVYRRLVEKLETAADGPNAFPAIVDAWLYQPGEEVRRVKGLAEDDPGFTDATEERLEDKLVDLSRRNSTFARVLRAYHRAMNQGDYGTAQGLLAWLGCQPHIDRSVTSKAGVSGKIDGQAALTFLAGVLQLFAVGQRLRDLSPSEQPSRIHAKVSDAFLRSLVDQVTTGFGGKVAVAPQLFLRELTDILARVDQHQDFDPDVHYKLVVKEDQLSAEELAALRGESAPADEEVDEETPTNKGPKRLDG